MYGDRSSKHYTNGNDGTLNSQLIEGKANLSCLCMPSRLTIEKAIAERPVACGTQTDSPKLRFKPECRKPQAASNGPISRHGANILSFIYLEYHEIQLCADPTSQSP